MGSSVVLDSGDTFSINKVVLDPTEVTEYVKNGEKTRYITLVEGVGIITVDTVDFRISAPHTLLVQPNQEYLIANTSKEADLIAIEILLPIE